MPWLKEYDPRVGFVSYIFAFESDYYRTNCNTPSRPTRIKALYDVPERARPRYLPVCPTGLENVNIAAVSL
jgi:hypothetical protein